MLGADHLDRKAVVRMTAHDRAFEPSEILEIEDDALTDLALDRGDARSPPGDMSIVWQGIFLLVLEHA